MPHFGSDKEQVIYELGKNKLLAHRVLFGHLHKNDTPPFHDESLALWHGDDTHVGEMAFRGAAKSTRAEEAIAIMACFQEVSNVVILGESETRAVERLRAIKYIFETNEFVQELFGIGQGDIWTEARITLSNGCMLQAYGRGQSLRGVKHLDKRPDLIFGDDLEDRDCVATPEAREKVLAWWAGTVVPAIDPQGRFRIAATPLHPEALAPKLVDAPSWIFRIYPIKHIGEDGAWRPTWPDRYPLQKIDEIHQSFKELGRLDQWEQEYMCRARNPAAQTFQPEMVKVEPRARSWHAVYAMYDPARTTHTKSATTGKAVWSWQGPKLIVWDAFAKKLMPNEIIEDMFATDDTFHPVAIGVEETGLNEWLRQPIRQQQVARGHLLPLRALNAPKGKYDFIRGLQPYFRAGEVEFARELPELRQQLLGFPNGDIDAPNALAYALKMTLGLPIYDGFTDEHIPSTQPSIVERAPLWLAVNSDGTVTTAALVQMNQGQMTVFADWLLEGDPGTALADVAQAAALEVPQRRHDGQGKLISSRVERQPLRALAPQNHWDAYGVVGLRAAARKIPLDLQRGGELPAGREELRKLMRTAPHGLPGLRVARRASWTLRALAGGYCRQADRTEPDDGAYAVLMHGVESFAGMLRGVGVRDDSRQNFEYTEDGRRFISARAR